MKKVKTIEELQKEVDNLRNILQTKSLEDAWIDGFEAAVKTAESFVTHVWFGPEATLDFALQEGVKSVKECLMESLKSLKDRKNGTADHTRS